jgi:hypothetical protein
MEPALKAPSRPAQRNTLAKPQKRFAIPFAVRRSWWFNPAVLNCFIIA